MLKRTGKAGNAEDTTFNQMRFFWQMLDGPKSRRSLTRYFLFITLVIGANAVVQVRLNAWQGSIYDAISSRDISIFMREIGVFLAIVSVLLCLGVAQTWLHERLKVRLRQAATFNLLDEWLKPARIFLLPLSGDMGVNPDQRIQEDTRRLSELTVDLTVGLVQSTLMLFAFVGVLWNLSSQVVFVIGDKPVTIPGYMVWAAIGYAALGSFVTYVVGRPLINAHARLRAAEAEFRFDLVRLNESAEGVALSRGETTERELLDKPLRAVLTIMRSIANRLATLMWVTGAYGWFAILAPLILAAPGYFGGTLTLGGLMMVVGGFYQVQTALRWYVDRFPALAEWRAMLGRVIDYRSALRRVEFLDGAAGRIRYIEDDPTGALCLEDLCVVAPNGRVTLGDPCVIIKPGERVLIVAPPKSGKTIFVKALAGLWVWGSGTIRLPSNIIFLPQVPYFPAGSLKAALAYPEAPERFCDADAGKALERVKLGQFANELDVEKRWDKELSLEEKRRLNLARLLLHRPKWVIKDESISELDEENRQIAFSIFSSELSGTAFISVGRHEPRHGFFHRTLQLKTRLPGIRLPLHIADNIPALPAA
jgi:vitamin B12/bleomycin/antimicrobial peptide transport system ATP-binding/permease protein